MNRRLIVAPDLPALHRQGAEIMADRIRAAIAARGRATVALSGGSTVRPAYELLATQTGIDWTKVYLFWGDDRFVPHDSGDSNYRLADEALFSRLPSLPRANIFPVPVTAPTPTAGAQQYAKTIVEFFGVEKGVMPRFDLAQNGLGSDGHTASIFPHANMPKPEQIAKMAHAGLSPWVDRVTLTPAVFNNARCVLFMAAGQGKAVVLKEVLEDNPSVRHRPAASIKPQDGELIWLVDRDIATLLTRRD